MFESLSDKLHDVFRKLRGQSTLTEANITDAMREIRLALLDADVNIKIASEFIEGVKAECVGQEVIKSVTPGQQVVKIVNDKLVELLGGGASELEFKSKPTVIMLVGLHGSGKTTTAGKLALLLKRQGKKVQLVAGDVYRPAAIDQLEIIGREIGVPVHAERTSVNVAAIAVNAVEQARTAGTDVVIIDTAGRLQIDETMVQELVRIRQAVRPDEVLLVADAALGQEAVSVAEHFHRALDLTGFILTKLDGDARGGAALSIRAATGKPIKYIGTGEKLDMLEPFHPDRMASRILGMGDVLSLIEKAEQHVDEEKAKKLEEKLKKNRFTLTDYYEQLVQLRGMGDLSQLAEMMPGGMGKQLAGAEIDPKVMAHTEAIILSMTPEERENPKLLGASRKKRVAAGCGLEVVDVNRLLKQFEMMQDLVKQMTRGRMPKGLGGFGGKGGMSRMHGFGRKKRFK